MALLNKTRPQAFQGNKPSDPIKSEGFNDYCLNNETGASLQWKAAIKDQSTRIKFVTAFVLLVIILTFFPVFFQYIESRNGYILSDPLLQFIPAKDFSVPIFIIIWSMSVLMIIRGIQLPRMFLLFMSAYVLLCITRMITILVFPLEPPADLIVLTDPLSNRFYGDSYITKDLFYSGHTSSQFLIFLCLANKKDKIIALIAALSVGCMVLIQHVHFSIDVLMAFPFTWFCYKLAQKWVKD